MDLIRSTYRSENPDGGTAITTGDLVLDILPDTLVMGPKTIVVTLTDVTSEDGLTIDAGQGPLRKELIIDLINDDD